MEKQIYKAPETEAVELINEGLICAPASITLTMILLDGFPETEVTFGRDDYGATTPDNWN